MIFSKLEIFLIVVVQPRTLFWLQTRSNLCTIALVALVNDVGVIASELISKIIQSRLTDYLEFRLSDTTWCLLERIAHRGYGKYVCLPNRRFLICKCKRSAAKVQPTCALFSYRLRTIALVAMATTCAEWDSHWNSKFWLGRYRTGCRRCCYKYVILTN